MKILYISALLLGLLTANAQNLLLFQDFNAGFPAGWQLIDEDGIAPYADPAVDFITDAYVVTEDYDSTSVGDSILVATSWLAETESASDYLILPNVTMGAYGNYISFDAKSIDAAYPDGIEVRVSMGGLNTWDFFALDAAYANEAVNPYWTNYTVSLDSVGATNESIFIAIRHTGNDGYILALDNIKVVSEDPVSVSENQLQKLTFSPNPTTDFVQVNVPTSSSYELLDLSGKVIGRGIVTNSRINLPSIESGIYFLNVSGYATVKIIKE